MRIACLCLALLLLPAARALGQLQGGTGQSNSSIGGRATFYRPQDADHGLWAPGVQGRLRLNKGYAAEFSADFTHHSIGQTTIDVVPVQATLLGFFYPDSTFTPYLLLGIGWYYTKVRDQTTHTENRWGPHAGVGVSLITGDHWSVDASYRFLWSQTYNITDAAHPIGQNFSGQGRMITLGLNMRL